MRATRPGLTHILRLVARSHTRAIPGRQVADNPGTIVGQSVLTPTRRQPDWLAPSEWRAIAGDPEHIRWSGDQDHPELFVRRLDRHTAHITDLDGNPYSQAMRIEDAIAILKEATS